MTAGAAARLQKSLDAGGQAFFFHLEKELSAGAKLIG